MNTLIDKIKSIGYKDFQFKNSYCLFKRTLYIWYIYGIVTLIPYHESIWSQNGIYPARALKSFNWEDILSLSTLPIFHQHYLALITATVLTLFLGLKYYNSRFLTIVIYFLTQNVFSLNPIMLDGGTSLSEIILFYTIFINSDKSENTISFSLNNFVNTAMFHLCRAQLVVVYLCAGIYKLNGELWQSGMALYYILQSYAYSHPLIIDYIPHLPLLAVLGTYFALFFQVSCPYFLLNKSTRKYWIMMGTLLHLGIAFAMGLFQFGTIMCIMYIMFYEDKFVKKLFVQLKSILNDRKTYIQNTLKFRQMATQFSKREKN